MAGVLRRMTPTGTRSTFTHHRHELQAPPDPRRRDPRCRRVLRPARPRTGHAGHPGDQRGRGGARSHHGGSWARDPGARRRDPLRRARCARCRGARPCGSRAQLAAGVDREGRGRAERPGAPPSRPPWRRAGLRDGPAAGGACEHRVRRRGGLRWELRVLRAPKHRVGPARTRRALPVPRRTRPSSTRAADRARPPAGRVAHRDDRATEGRTRDRMVGRRSLDHGRLRRGAQRQPSSHGPSLRREHDRQARRQVRAQGPPRRTCIQPRHEHERATARAHGRARARARRAPPAHDPDAAGGHPRR